MFILWSRETERLLCRKKLTQHLIVVLENLNCLEQSHLVISFMRSLPLSFSHSILHRSLSSSFPPSLCPSFSLSLVLPPSFPPSLPALHPSTPLSPQLTQSSSSPWGSHCPYLPSFNRDYLPDESTRGKDSSAKAK
jgi:hypothetical protein